VKPLLRVHFVAPLVSKEWVADKAVVVPAVVPVVVLAAVPTKVLADSLFPRSHWCSV
jgi:hypothetical protein